MAEEGVGSAPGGAAADDRTILDDLTVLAGPHGAPLEAGQAQPLQPQNRTGGLDELTTIHQGSSVQPQLSTIGVNGTFGLVAAGADGLPLADAAPPASGFDAAASEGGTIAGEGVVAGRPAGLSAAGSGAAAGPSPGGSAGASTSQPPAASAVPGSGGAAAGTPAAGQGVPPVPAAQAPAHIDSGTTATASPQAIPPDLRLSPAEGYEDGRIALTLTASPGQGGDAVVVAIGGMPAGAVLRSGETVLTPDADGLYRLTPAQLQDLNLLPPPDDAHDFTLSVVATGTNLLGVSASSPAAALHVTVTGIAHTPSEIHTGAAAGLENARIALNVAQHANAANETLGLTIAGAPEGSLFYASADGGSPIGSHNADGSWSFTAAEIALANQSGHGFYLQAPTNWSDYDSAGHNAGIALTATLTASDVDPDTLAVSRASLVDGFTVHVAGVALAPTVGVSPAAGPENGTIRLTISGSVPQTSEEITGYDIAGLPDGATLNHGTYDAASGLWHLTPEQLADLAVVPAADDARDFTLTVTATAKALGENVDPAHLTATSAPASLPVTVTGRAYTPVLAQTAAADGIEDARVALNLTAATSHDDNLLSLVIAGVPADARFYDSASGGSAIGTRNADGSWSFTADELALAGRSGHGLYLQLAPDWNDYDSAGHDTGLLLTATLTATETDPDTLAVAQASTSLDFAVHVAGVADTPTLSVGASVTTPENGTAALAISAVAVTDTETISAITIGGVPAGAGFTDGSGHAVGSDLGGGVWTFTADQLSGLHVVPAANDARNFTLTVTAISQELGGNAAQATAGSAAATIAVKVVGCAAVPVIDLPGTVTGTEDSLVNLNLSLHAQADEVLAMSIAGVVAGSHFYADAAGTVAIGTYHAATGLWTFSALDIATAGQSGNGFHLQAPTGWSDYDSAGHSAGMALTVTVGARETDPDTGIVSTSRASVGTSLHILAADDGSTLHSLSALSFTFADLQGLPADGTTGSALSAGQGLDGLVLPAADAHQIADAHAALDFAAASAAHDALLLQSGYAQYADGFAAPATAEVHAAADFHTAVAALPAADGTTALAAHTLIHAPADDRLVI